MGAWSSGDGGKPKAARVHMSGATSTKPAIVLERVRDRQRDTAYAVRCTIRKPVATCPMTGTPLYAYIVVDYVPNGWLIDARALEAYVTDTHYFGAFHESSTLQIAQELLAFLEPKWLRVGGYWHPSDGVPIDVYFQSGPTPASVWVPDQKPPQSRGDL